MQMPKLRCLLAPLTGNSYTDITLSKHRPHKAVYFYIESYLTVCLSTKGKVYIV